MEDKLGTLENGKLADITIINNNLFEIDENDIPKTEAVMTIVDGKIVYEK
jgi:predicted amidohydrolase YtcJ